MRPCCDAFRAHGETCSVRHRLTRLFGRREDNGLARFTADRALEVYDFAVGHVIAPGAPHSRKRVAIFEAMSGCLDQMNSRAAEVTRFSKEGAATFGGDR